MKINRTKNKWRFILEMITENYRTSQEHLCKNLDNKINTFISIKKRLLAAFLFLIQLVILSDQQ